MQVTKVVIFIGSLQKYRVPIFEEISKKFDLTIVCDNADTFQSRSLPFKVINCPLKKIGPFIYHQKSIRNISKNFDVTIGLLNIRYLDLILFSLLPLNKGKLILWGIGANASYNKSFGSKDLALYLRIAFAKLADSLIFYSTYPIEFYKKFGISENKIFVANNTVKTANYLYNTNKEGRNNFLFIGSLYREKGLDTLIDCYSKAFVNAKDDLKNLLIVGEGEDLEYLKKKVDNLHLTSKISFTGAIYDELVLMKIFEESLICISPNQAGLSVLKSMAYGVPFVTRENAITGGERLNIKNEVNGYLFQTDDELENILIDASFNPDKYLESGYEAYKYYRQYRAPEMMAKSIADAIQFVTR